MFAREGLRPFLGLGLILHALPLTGASSELNFDFPFDALDPVPFRPHVDQEFIDETVYKASRYRPSIDLEDNDEVNRGFKEGPARANMTAIARYWGTEYDWPAVEEEIFSNHSHYAVTVPGPVGDYEHDVSFHFVHERSDDDDAIPLLLIHGWPSTHLEWTKVVTPLTSPGSSSSSLNSSSGSGSTQAFHVVAPDLPGFGFSPAPTHSGLGSRQLGAALDKLMRTLGYDRYGVCSTDLGWSVGLFMAAVVPGSLIGHYSDFWFVFPNATDIDRRAANQTTPEEAAYMDSLDGWFDQDYIHGPAYTKAPLALAQAMTDTPVGFAGWVWQLSFPISDGYPYTIKDLITNAFTLFIQGTFGASRLYKEVFRYDIPDLSRTEVPAGAGRYASPNAPLDVYKNIHLTPRSWMERVANIVYVSTHDRGGHFPAHNVPDEYVADVREFFTGLVNGDDGPQ